MRLLANEKGEKREKGFPEYRYSGYEPRAVGKRECKIS